MCTAQTYKSAKRSNEHTQIFCSSLLQRDQMNTHKIKINKPTTICKPALGEPIRAKVLPLRFWTLLDKTYEELTCLQVWNRWLGSWSHRLVIKLQRRFTPLLKHMPWSEAHHGWRPPKIYGILKHYTSKRLIKMAQDLAVLCRSFSLLWVLGKTVLSRGVW